MEFAKNEDAIRYGATVRTEGDEVVELTEAQLAVIGGGVGEVGLG